MKNTRSIIIPLALLLVSLSTAIWLQNGMIDQWHKTPKRFRDTLYLPSSEYTRVITLGYNQFAADFLWLRMIQTFAASWSAAVTPTQLNNYAQVISDLDPRFNEPYAFAIMGIGEEGRSQVKINISEKKKIDPFGDPFLSLATVDKYVQDIIAKSIVKDPGDYHVPYDGAFFAWWSLEDGPLAKYYCRMAKQDPNYPDYIDRWEGYFDLKQGRYLAAFEKYLTDYVNTIRIHNKDLYAINRMQLSRTLNSWLVDEIRSRALAWEKTRGKLPTVEELRQAGSFKGVEYPDVAKINAPLLGMLRGEVDTNVTDQEVRDWIKKVIVKWDDLPPGPFDFIDSRYRGYTIWEAMRTDGERFILPQLEALRVTKDYMMQAAMDIAKSKVETGKLFDLKSHFEPILGKTDPWGKPWIFDQAAGVVKSATWPEIMTMKIPEENEKQ